MQGIDVTELALQLCRSRTPAMDLAVSSAPGVYACFLRDPSLLPPFRPGSNGLVCVDRAENPVKRGFADHFNERGTDSSTLRRSLGAILKSRLALKALPRGSGRPEQDFFCQRFDPEGETRLNEWTREHREVSLSTLCRIPLRRKGASSGS